MNGASGTKTGLIGAGVLLLLFVGLVLPSCSGPTDDPAVAVRRLVNAHGGSEGIERVTTYVGRGFLRELRSTTVAKSHPFDVWQDGERYKSKASKISGGRFNDCIITVYDGLERYRYYLGEGSKKALLAEADRVRYRFPQVLEWIRQPGIEGDLIPPQKEGEQYVLRIQDEANTVWITIDPDTWLLKEVEVENEEQRGALLGERYRDYRRVDGIWFPSRYTGTLKGSPTYEYFLSAIEFFAEIPDSVFAVTADDTTIVY